MYRIKDRKFIGVKIRNRRRELGWTQEELAEAIGVTYQQLQRYEGGKVILTQTGCRHYPMPWISRFPFFFDEISEDKIKVKEAVRYISPEEREFVDCLRQIDNEEYKKSIKVFLQLAAGRKKKN